jgi:hypothetical protein
MNAITREELTSVLKIANIKSRIKRDIRFVPEEITNWENRDFLAVTNRSRSEGVLIAPLEKLYIMPFELQKRVSNKTGRVEAIICDFCATWQRGSNSAIISFQKDKVSVSFLCCADLLCSLHVRSQTTASTLSRVQLRENNSAEDRIRRLGMRLETILSSI